MVVTDNTIEGVAADSPREVTGVPPTPDLARLPDEPLIRWFKERSSATPTATFFRFKRLGLWHDVTYSRAADDVAACALWLLAAGATAGDRLAFMGHARPEWVYITLAAQSLGMLTFGLYPTTAPEEMAHLLNDGEARFFLAEDQEYVDKVLAISQRLPALERIIVVDPRGMFDYDDERIVAVRDVLRNGRELAAADPAVWSSAVDARSADAPVAIFYTSGTTGLAKGVVLTSRNMTSMWVGVFTELEPPSERDSTVALWPPAQVVEQGMSLFLPILFGVIAHIPEDEDAITQAMSEVQPTLLVTVPRTWETSASQSLVGIETSSRVKRTVYRSGMRVRRRFVDSVEAGRHNPLLAGVAWLAHFVAGRPILDKFGYRRLRLVLTGGAPLSADLVRLWRMWGLTIRETYGQTEASPFIAAQLGRNPTPGNAGRPLAGVQIRLSDDEEILARGPNVFAEYWRNPTATATALDADGWLHTGDLGRIQPDGSLRVIDRKKDVIVMTTGQSVAAASIESRLKFSPYVRDAVVIGEARPALTALIEIDFDVVAEWARAHKIQYTSFTNLASRTEVQALIATAIEDQNRQCLDEGIPLISAFRVLPQELDPEAGEEVTPTRKVRRAQLAAKFESLISEMYETEESRRIAREARR